LAPAGLPSIRESHRESSLVPHNLTIQPQTAPVTVSDSPVVKFSPSKRDGKEVDATAPVYGEVSADATKNISQLISKTYKQT
jgi:hypothetical protein